jgi:hypothetical protein
MTPDEATKILAWKDSPEEAALLKKSPHLHGVFTQLAGEAERVLGLGDWATRADSVYGRTSAGRHRAV